MSSLANNIRIRGSYKAKLTSLENFVNILKNATPSSKPEISEVQLRHDSGSNLLVEFDQIQLQIEIATSEDKLQEQVDERDAFENRYFKAISFLKDYINTNTVINTLPPSSTPHVDSLNHLLMPKMKIPVFKGDFEQWLEFKATFTSVVHSNTTLPDIHKFQLLRQSVDGYAKRIVDKIEFSGNYYQTAWDALCMRYDNKKLLVNKHIKAIFNLDSIQKESPKHLRHLLDSVSDSMSSIDSLQITKSSLTDLLLIYIISDKLDKQSYREWKECHIKEELPTLTEFFNFLKVKVDTLEEIQDQSSQKPNNNYSNNSGFNYKHANRDSRGEYQKRVFQVNVAERKSCVLCKGNHLIYSCIEFLKLDTKNRLSKVNNLKLCHNCLRHGHKAAECTLRPCIKCNSKHNSLIHFENSQQHSTDTALKSPLDSSSVNCVQSDEMPPTVTHQFSAQTMNIKHTQVLLSTVVFNVKSNNHELIPCRAILDSGAQTNLIKESFCKKLNMSMIPTNLAISAISNQIPSTSFDIKNFNIPCNIQLSDPLFNESGSIDAIIGAHLFWDLLCDGKINLGKGLPSLQNTKLGWIVNGAVPYETTHAVCHFTRTIAEDEQLKLFWELDSIQDPIPPSKDDICCEQIFETTTTRSENGHFIVQLPFKFSPELLGESLDTAISRFLLLEKRFSRNRELNDLYKQFIKEYQELGHMVKVNPTVSLHPSRKSYFLPHHGVLKETSLTTKLRVVYDGSCPTTSGWSLNDLQYTGPKIQNDIFDILIRFRQYTYVVSADVSKMYRQVIVHEENRPLQQIVWRDNPTDNIDVYQLTTVTYGQKSAPFLAMRCMRQLAFEHESQFPLAAKSILEDFYVDDLLTGSNNLQELQMRCNDIFKILESGKFILRKWISNNPETILNINCNDISNNVINIGDSDSFKTLGIQWMSQQDILCFKISLTVNSNHLFTKRQILSIISKIYDPLGLLSPVILIAKLIIQTLFRLQKPWDEIIPPELNNSWTKLYNQLPCLNKLHIPRPVLGSGHKITSIHCFCDASMHAYASCIYVCSIDPESKYHSHILCSKTKVAPIKSITIPKLELCAALLGSQLIDKVTKSLSILNMPIYMWSDSKIVLSWLKLEPSQLQVFVANRVTKIQSLTSSDSWHYINTKENAADIASRGIFPEFFLESQLWFQGPQFLRQHPDLWPNDSTDEVIELPELKRSVHVSLHSTVQNSWITNFITRFSNLHKMKRVFSYVMRFIRNIKNKTRAPSLLLTVHETNDSFLLLIKLVQAESFHDDIFCLLNDKPLSKKSRLLHLSPILDKGLLKVGGRLMHSTLPENVKTPILLPKFHVLTKLICTHYHVSNLHPGPQLLLSLIRQQYWPISGKVLVKQIVRQCVKCFRVKPPHNCVKMGPLPNERIIPAYPFENVGLDYAGPFPLKEKKGRGSFDDPNFESVAEQWLEECDSDSNKDLYPVSESEHFSDSEQSADNGKSDNHIGNEYDISASGTFVGKNGFEWRNNQPPEKVRTRKHNIILQLPGLRQKAKILGDNPEVVDVWELLFTEAIIKEIVQWTNVKIDYAKRNFTNKTSASYFQETTYYFRDSR
ncbi:uncharacterized protein [Diabrotica undecimpunctata]|uniref:uncharacterized protein n=1 Tax=Diabrotica undecimpunctata TaxID=50387 RepID=UPI003B63F97C